MTKHYYRGAHGVILVFDITSLDSFNNLGYWLTQVRNCTPEGCVIGLMANKVDIMFGEPEKREVYREQAFLFSRDNGLVWIDECSALAGINIDETFLAIAEKIYDTQMYLINAGKVSRSSLKLREADTSRHYQSRCCY